MNQPTGLTPATPAGMGPVTLTSDVSPDVIAWLPKRAAEKLRQLRDHVDELHLLVPVFEDRKSANEARYMAEKRLERLQAHVSDGGFNLSADDPRVRDERRNVARLAAEAKRVGERYETRAAAWQKAGACLTNVEAWLTGGRPAGTMLEDFDAPEPKINKGESLPDVIERHRQHVRELKAELDRTRRAPLPSVYVKQRLREQIEALAARGAPSVARLVEHDLDIDFAAADYSTPVIGGSKEHPVTAIASWQQPDAMAFVCWMLRDELVKRLEAMIPVGDKNALSPDERKRREAEIMVDLLQAERTDAALTWRAMGERLPVDHRADVNPLALLSLSLRTATPDDASPGSSLDHALSFVGLR